MLSNKSIRKELKITEMKHYSVNVKLVSFQWTKQEVKYNFLSQIREVMRELQVECVLIVCSAYSLNLKMEETHSSQMSITFTRLLGFTCHKRVFLTVTVMRTKNKKLENICASCHVVTSNFDTKHLMHIGTCFYWHKPVLPHI